MPCKGGYRQSIEEGKRFNEQARAHEQSPERKYWLNLVSRVHGTADGFEKLSGLEKTYFAVSCLLGEVYNGGFEQFFSNTSGTLYGAALDGLIQLEALTAAALLLRAKEILFGYGDVPVDRKQRIELMQTVSNDNAPEWRQLYELDKEFCEDPDKLAERCHVYGITNRLYPDG